jgi:hypothetical protein
MLGAFGLSWLLRDVRCARRRDRTHASATYRLTLT